MSDMIDPRQSQSIKVCIKNVKSGRYLSVEGYDSDWSKDEASLTIRTWQNRSILESSQVWNIIKFREESWILMNQYSMFVACIHKRSTENGEPVVQYHTQGLSFQEWNFKQLSNNNWLIQNKNSKKYIGPNNRTTGDDEYCIQWEDQTSEDSYQEWVFEPPKSK